MSGLQIFNAHPRLYIGKYGADNDQAFVSAGARGEQTSPQGYFRISALTIPTTGVIGVSYQNGQPVIRGFPSWITLPGYQDLATGRRWHFFFAWLFVLNGLAYLIYGILAGHFRRDLVPSGDQLTAAHLKREIADHARLRFPKDDEARRYNVLQKGAYLSVVFILLPLMVLTGISMSPGMNAALPWLVEFFGGRQTARTIHFIAASLLVIFVIVHLFMVVASGFWNNLRSMVTGRYAIEQGEDSK
jgi:thiosulfate reductase cytochrome b subunit